MAGEARTTGTPAATAGGRVLDFASAKAKRDRVGEPLGANVDYIAPPYDQGWQVGSSSVRHMVHYGLWHGTFYTGNAVCGAAQGELSRQPSLRGCRRCRPYEPDTQARR